MSKHRTKLSKCPPIDTYQHAKKFKNYIVRTVSWMFGKWFYILVTHTASIQKVQSDTLCTLMSQISEGCHELFLLMFGEFFVDGHHSTISWQIFQDGMVPHRGQTRVKEVVFRQMLRVLVSHIDDKQIDWNYKHTGATPKNGL